MEIMLTDASIDMINSKVYFDDTIIKELVKNLVDNNDLNDFVTSIQVLNNVQWEAKYEHYSKTIYIKNNLDGGNKIAEHNINIFANVIHELIHANQFRFLTYSSFDQHPNLYLKLFESIYTKYQEQFSSLGKLSLSEYQGYLGSLLVTLKCLSRLNGLAFKNIYQQYLKATRNMIINGYVSYSEPYCLKSPIDNANAFNYNDMDFYAMIDKNIVKKYQLFTSLYDFSREYQYLNLWTRLFIGYNITETEFNSLVEDQEDKVTHLIQRNNTYML